MMIDFRRQFDERIYVLAVNSEDDVATGLDKIIPNSNSFGPFANTRQRERTI